MLSQSHFLLLHRNFSPVSPPSPSCSPPTNFSNPNFTPISRSFPKLISPLSSRTRFNSRPIMSSNVTLSDSGEAAESTLKNPSSFLGVASLLAKAAGDVIRQYFRKRLVIFDKEDLSPVTIADRLAEQAMVAIIRNFYPSHGIFGEEKGWRSDKKEADYVWVLDPIDGTKSFITGKPVFGTLIALLHKGKPILGIIDQPILRERWVGLSGGRTFFNGQEISTRRCEELSQAYMYTTSPHLFSGDAEMAFARVREKVKVPLYGCDCYAYALLAAGFVDLVIESGLKPYDFLALIPVIEGAGGSITDWKGDELNWQPSADSRPTSFNVVAAGDKQIHLQALHALQWH